MHHRRADSFRPVERHHQIKGLRLAHGRSTPMVESRERDRLLQPGPDIFRPAIRDVAMLLLEAADLARVSDDHDATRCRIGSASARVIFGKQLSAVRGEQLMTSIPSACKGPTSVANFFRKIVYGELTWRGWFPCQ